ncbi:hypothetical protein KIPB_003694, partial [Kipferlia bialata]
ATQLKTIPELMASLETGYKEAVKAEKTSAKKEAPRRGKGKPRRR